MTSEVIKKLSEAALDVRKKAYCPYSGFAVGAAHLLIDVLFGLSDALSVTLTNGASNAATTLTTLTAACTALFRAGCASQALQAQTAA